MYSIIIFVQELAYFKPFSIRFTEKPMTPNISGTMREVVGNISQLTCSSELNTFPVYYSKLLAMRYSWFLNDTKLSGATHKTLSVNVNKRTKYNRYSCTASDMLESNRSSVLKIDPLCKLKRLIS